MPHLKFTYLYMYSFVVAKLIGETILDKYVTKINVEYLEYYNKLCYNFTVDTYFIFSNINFNYYFLFFILLNKQT